jgi:hypothetical protein
MACGYSKRALDFPKKVCYTIIIWDRGSTPRLWGDENYPQIWTTDSLSHWESQVKGFAEQNIKVTAFRAHPAEVVEEVEVITKTTKLVKIAEDK